MIKWEAWDREQTILVIDWVLYQCNLYSASKSPTGAVGKFFDTG